MSVMVRPSGPIPAQVMVLGEAPGAEEEARGEPFVGASGNELTKMLHEAGISRSECFITNVARERPPGNDISYFIAKAKKEITSEHILVRDHWVRQQVKAGLDLLHKEVEMVKPGIIIAFGNTALWAVTGLWGIVKWRGSMLHCDFAPSIRVLPTYHPAAILRQWDWRAIAVHDLRRAAAHRHVDWPVPGWKFTIRPSFIEATEILNGILRKLHESPIEISFDLETKNGHIDCAGLAWSKHEAICVPFACDYWPDWEEAELVYLFYCILTHPNARVIGQNLLYDSQYTYRWWHFIPRVYQDTMISHHTAFTGLPKKFDFQASMYCEYYKQWKPDRGQWKAGG